jgi:hypothetical protein
MGIFFKYYVYALLFSPLIGYFSFTYTGFYAPQLLSYTVIALFSVFIITKNKPIIIPKFLYFYFCYIVYIFIWRLYNGYIDLKGPEKYVFNNYYVYSALLIIVIYNVKIGDIHFLKTITLIRIILIIALIGALLQFFFDPMLFVRPYGWNTDEGSIYLSRRTSVFTWVSDNEYGISVLAYFSLLLSIDSLKKENLKLICFLVLVGIYSIITNTRYVMIGYVLVVAQMLLKQKISKIVRYFVFFLFTIFATYYVYTNLLGLNLKELAEKRLFAEGDIKNTSRYLAYELFIKYYPENPLFGTGVHLTNEIRRAANEGGSSQVHVGYLAHMVSFGLIGSLLLFSFWFFLARDLLIKARHTGFYGAFFAFLVFLWANMALVDYDIFYPGILIALVYSEYYNSRFLQARFKMSINSNLINQKNSVPRYL